MLSSLLSFENNSKQLRFGVFSAAEVHRLAVVECFKPTFYDPNSQERRPIGSGVLDAKLVRFFPLANISRRVMDSRRLTIWFWGSW